MGDKYRDSNQRRDHYEQTEQWHYVDIEIDGGDLEKACFGRPTLPVGTLASSGPAQACVVDKINQFAGELAAPGTDAVERLFALKCLLHFVGDVHQPLHSSDHHDRGGNEVKVSADGIQHNPKDELHGYWDTQFVDALAPSPQALASKLAKTITSAQAASWAKGR
jgi:hypothetical protein